MAADYLLQEDGVSRIILEDGSGFLLLESSTDTVAAHRIPNLHIIHHRQRKRRCILSARGDAPWISLCEFNHKDELF